MASSNNIFNEMLARIQEVLKEFNCKSESRINEHDAMLFGKFSAYMEKYTVVVHLREESYNPVTTQAGHVEVREADHKIHFMPSLELQTTKSHTANCSEKEQMNIREQFIKEAESIGREFLQKINKGYQAE